MASFTNVFGVLLRQLMDLRCHLNLGGHSPTLDPEGSYALLIEQQSLDEQEVRARAVQAVQIRNT
jgi:hypothetical protein